jgi:threonine dehydratase
MISAESIVEARDRIAPHILRTPLIYSPTFSEMTGARVYLKLENLQKAGSFKVRGATNKILCNIAVAKEHGVVAASAGNHAQGVAVAAGRAGVAATVVMPVWAAAAKQEATKGYGARVILSGITLEESVAHALSLARGGMLFIHPYDDEEVIAGQGTIGLEILEGLPETDRILVPVGGGGLIAGIATAVKAQKPSCTITGVQAMACPSAYEALRAKKPVCVLPKPTIADGIRVAQAGVLTLPVIHDRVDGIALVTEDAIAEAMLHLIERKKVIAEGAGATPLAALLGGAVKIEKDSTVVLVISGGNVDSPVLDRTIRRGLALQGKILACTVAPGDRPDSLAGLFSIVEREKGEILVLRHDARGGDLSHGDLRVYLEAATRGEDHSRAILSALANAGYKPGAP